MAIAKKSQPKKKQPEKPAVRSSKVFMVWPEQLKERKGNNRFEFGNIDELAKTIVSSGIRIPLQVRKTDEITDDNYPIFEIVDGHRRYRAAKRIASKMEEGDFIPVQILDDPSEADCIVTSLITGEQGKPRNMLEAAYDIHALVGMGISQAVISKQIGKSAQYVSDCLQLIEKATPQIIKSIKDGEIRPYDALEMLKGTEASEVETAVVKAVDKRKKQEAETPIGKKVDAKKKPLKKTEIEEEHGAPLTLKGKKQKANEVEKPEKQAGGVTELKQLRTTLKANAGAQKKSNFNILSGLISYLEGKTTGMDLLPFFFWHVDEEVDTLFVKDSEEPAKAVTKGGKKEEKKLEPKKPTKGVQTLKDKKAAAKRRDLDEEEPTDDDLEGIDDLDEDFEEE